MDNFSRNCQPSRSHNGEIESRTSSRTLNGYRRRSRFNQWSQTARINNDPPNMSFPLEDDDRSRECSICRNRDDDVFVKWEYIVFAIILGVASCYVNKRFEEVFKYLHEIKMECMGKETLPAPIQTSESIEAQHAKETPVEIQTKTSDILNELLKQTLEIYATVRNASVDFALEAAGGSVITSSGELHNTGVYPNMPNVPDVFKQNGPRAILQESDDCWTFQGSSASTVVQLIGNISISGVGLGYLRQQSEEIKCAPREFSVWGLTHAHDKEGERLGLFTYKNDGDNQLQDFEMGHQRSYELIELKIHSNYGNPLYTSVHRFCVYGKLDDSKK